MSGEWLAIELLIGSVAVGVHALFAARARSSGKDTWRSVAERRGLVPSHTGLLTTYAGTIDGLQVDVRMGAIGVGAGQTVGTFVEVTGQICAALQLDSSGLDFGKLYRPESLQRDNLDEARVCATLDANTRRQASRLAKKTKARVSGGTVGILASELRGADAEEVLNDALELARLLSLPAADVPARLLRNLQDEPLPEVKLHNHKLLLLCYPRTPEGQRALELARSAGDPELTLLRAELLPERPFEAARQLALSRDLRTPVRLKALALAVAQNDASFPQLLAQLIVDPDATLSRAAVRLVQRGHAQAILAALVARAAAVDAGDAAGLVTAFVELNDPAAEPALLGLLVRHEGALRAEVVRALQALGSLRAVEPLLALEAEGQPGAREAITAIQARVGNAEAGRLSVVKGSDAEGALSLAEPAQGALTLVDSDRRR